MELQGPIPNLLSNCFNCRRPITPLPSQSQPSFPFSNHDFTPPLSSSLLLSSIGRVSDSFPILWARLPCDSRCLIDCFPVSSPPSLLSRCFPLPSFWLYLSRHRFCGAELAVRTDLHRGVETFDFGPEILFLEFRAVKVISL
ncbi:hypothetical protein K1719_037331 [Acacia pycnantha]|nr:hypothetical protein K1719_037331 [Acacia pycnantha]